ncbi:MAG: response regulator [Patescibacteria group bacterium]
MLLATQSKPLILVVDDDGAFLEIISTQLDAAGFGVALLQTERAEDVILECERILPHLVLLDIYMPSGLSGFHIAMALKQNYHTRTIKVLFWSTLGNVPQDLLRAHPELKEEFKPDDFVDKGVDFEMLLDKIKRVLSSELTSVNV